MNVILTDDARGDLLRAVQGYEQRRVGLGSEYRAALDATITRILCYPTAFEPRERGLRRALVSRFPHTLYFRIYPEALVIVALLPAETRAQDGS